MSTIICTECQQLHIQLTSTQELTPNTVLSLALPAGCPLLLIQFDGSCHSHIKAGGAGVAALQITANDTYLTHWSSVAIPDCADNILAEAHACKEALLLAVDLHNQYPFAFRKIIIQGDILPLINHMNHKGRIRRIEIAQIMEECQLLASQLSTIIHFEYLPRECNCLADYFAGFASAFLSSQPLDNKTKIEVPLPYSLLHQHGFMALTDYLHHNPQSLTAWHQYRARFSQPQLTVHYRPT